MPSLQDFDMDENLIHKVNSKYYDIIDFTMVNKNPNSLPMFHINLRSLSAHVEELQPLLKSLIANLMLLQYQKQKNNQRDFLKMFLWMDI